MNRDKRPGPIVVSDTEPGLPYSKGLMASRVMVTGLSPYRSYKVAERIEDDLIERDVASITAEELEALALRMIEDEAGDRYARNFERWQEIARLDVPIVILIGGATGVGKSTIATQIAGRMGIVRVIPTDAVREVMRGLFSRELMPTLYTSSFDADAALREAPGKADEKVVVGFREQTAAVAVGVRALIERAAVEGTSAIIEGAHVVPGFLDVPKFTDQVLAVPLVVTVEDQEMHRSHFVARSADSALRPFDRYLTNFDNIRRVQKYIRSQALSHDWPVLSSYNLDQTIAAVIDMVMEKASARLAHAASPEQPTLDQIEGGAPRETVP